MHLSALAYATRVHMAAADPGSDGRAGRDVPNCPFDGQLKSISGNNEPLNLHRLPGGPPPPPPERRGGWVSLIYAGSRQADPVFIGPVCQLVIEEHRGTRQRRRISDDRLGSSPPPLGR